MNPFFPARQACATVGTPKRLLVLVAIACTFSLSLIASGSGLVPGDLKIAREVQATSQPNVVAFVQFMNWVNDVQRVAIITGLLSLAFAARGRFAEAVIIAATFLSQGANWFLKQVAASPRPGDQQVNIMDVAAGFGFPSGHTMSAVALYGVIMYLTLHHIQRRSVRYLVCAVSVAVMLAIGFSRIYAGAHWPSDVLGSYLWGFWFVLGLGFFFRWLSTRPQAKLPFNAE